MRCPHGVEVPCIACIFYDKTKTFNQWCHANHEWIFFWGVIFLCILIAVFVIFNGIERKPVVVNKELPPGWSIEYNEFEDQYRWCQPDKNFKAGRWCSNMSQNKSKQVVIESALNY